MHFRAEALSYNKMIPNCNLVGLLMKNPECSTFNHLRLTFLVVTLLVVTALGCRQSPPTSKEEPLPALKHAFEDEFLMGAALNRGQVSGKFPDDIAVVEKHFNTITPENLLKWENVHPEPDMFNFSPVDRYVKLGEANEMFIVGHTLVWHNQTPDWVFRDQNGNPLSREALLDRMRQHIVTVVERYRGRIDGWDVVNEALNEDGSYRQTPWFHIMGVSYIEHAFRLAKKADPDAELYYNDYNLWKPEKRQGVVRLVTDLQSKGVKIDGIGMQGHWALDHPPIQQIEESILAFSELGVKVMITELDVDVLPSADDDTMDFERNEDVPDYLDPYKNGLPDSIQTRFTNRYVRLFELLDRHSDKISRVTFWGVNDRQSWKNNWPIRGRTNYPLLFDRQNQPKDALEKVLDVGQDS